MKSVISIIVFIAPLFCAAQSQPVLSFKVAPDTSYLVFEGMSPLSVRKSVAGRNTSFTMTRNDFKSLINTVAYLQSSRQTSFQSLAVFENQIAVGDSSRRVLEAKLQLEAERVANFKKGFDDMKQTCDAQHQHLDECISDLRTLNAKTKRVKAWSIIKGGLIGLVAGLVAGSVL